MRFGSLFAGIGGIDLGLERAGMECAWQVENDPYCLQVLARHWPDISLWDDIRLFNPDKVQDEVDVICGGFPCQDISKAGHVQAPRDGIDGKRSGLWSEYVRVIRVLRPRFVLVENVAKLLVRGLGRVLGDLAALGYDAEWHCVPAADFGTPHIRDRVFILAYPVCNSIRLSRRAPIIGTPPPMQGETRQWCRLWTHPFAVGPADGMEGDRHDDPWQFEPRMGRVVDGVPFGLERNRALGNAVVPQVAEWIGRQILAHEEMRKE